MDLVEEWAQEYRGYFQYVEQTELRIEDARKKMYKAVLLQLMRHAETFVLPPGVSRPKEFYFVGRGVMFQTKKDVEKTIAVLQKALRQLLVDEHDLQRAFGS